MFYFSYSIEIVPSSISDTDSCSLTISFISSSEYFLGAIFSINVPDIVKDFKNVFYSVIHKQKNFDFMVILFDLSANNETVVFKEFESGSIYLLQSFRDVLQPETDYLIDTGNLNLYRQLFRVIIMKFLQL